MKKLRQLFQESKWQEVIEGCQKNISDPKLTDDTKKESYLLAGSALKNLGKIDEAIEVLTKAKKQYPNFAAFYHNLGNCYKRKGSAGNFEAIKNYLLAQRLGHEGSGLALSLARLYQELSFPGLAYSCLRDWLISRGGGTEIDPNMLTTLMDLTNTVLQEDEAEKINDWCLENFGEIGENSLEGQASLAIQAARRGDEKESLAWFDRASSTLENIKKDNLIRGISDNQNNEEQNLINAGWNLSCSLLKKGIMKQGWNYYNYGLQTPATGMQRWQRALEKPVAHTIIPVWNGENLKGKSLLILGEQAIGDTMMFLQLLPYLRKECKLLGLHITSRLTKLYQRSFKEVEIYDDANELSAEQLKRFDYQIPCGSIPYFRIEKWLKEGWEQSKLIPNQEFQSSLKNQYRSENSDQKLIGISWSGGGRADRIRAKSLTLDQYSEVFRSFPNAKFVSLQYGNVKSAIDKWQHEGFNVFNDESINALEDMDKWMAQVSCCDFIISVANTTIHGAGCLNIPTFCLQSRNSDWRWIEKLRYSYWYESVETSFQNKDGSWDQAIHDMREWAKTIGNSPITKSQRSKEILKSMKF